MMPDFVPGPWRLDMTEVLSEALYVRSPEGRILAQVVQPLREPGSVEGTAHLIAAAPELYAACEAACQSCWGENYGDCDKCKVFNALKKARGEE